jgi:hypothetical protein
MSNELSSRAEPSHGHTPTDALVNEPEDSWVRGLRLQAAEVIAEVLSDSSPGQARARDQLRRLLQANPGRPEVALAEHLIALREEAAQGRRTELTLVTDEAAADTPAQPSRPGARRSPGRRSAARQPLLHHRPTARVRYGRADGGLLGGLSGDGA